tara:strand:+ start:2437 stop:2643 length:207 start_codon:yes stop_codon:yes gene_type:complete
MILNITQSGKRQAKEIGGKGVEQSILSTLDENGPASLDELARDIGIPEPKVREAAIRLANNGHLRKED